MDTSDTILDENHLSDKSCETTECENVEQTNEIVDSVDNENDLQEKEPEEDKTNNLVEEVIEEPIDNTKPILIFYDPCYVPNFGHYDTVLSVIQSHVDRFDGKLVHVNNKDSSLKHHIYISLYYYL